MPSGVRDIQLLELKDTISQLNNTISTQNELIRSLQKMLQERDAKDSEKDQLIANLQAQLDYLKTRLFGSTSEIRHEQLPGQLDLFHLQTEDEPEPVPLEVEYIEVKAHKKARKSKAAYDEVFADLPTENVYVDTLTEEQKTCDVCGTMMVPIGHEPIRTELRYTEPKLERIDYYATTYECPQCKETEDQGFLYCNKLFEYERSYREKGLSPKQIYNRRRKDQKPVIEAFLSWLDAQTPVKGSRLDQAVIYIRNRKDSLMTYLEDGRCSLSNNLSENAIRPITVGRKNWLFCDSVDGANASAICFTMIEMAKAYDLNVYKYLNFLLEKRPNARTAQKELEKLAPWNEEVQKMFARKMK